VIYYTIFLLITIFLVDHHIPQQWIKLEEEDEGTDDGMMHLDR